MLAVPLLEEEAALICEHSYLPSNQSISLFAKQFETPYQRL